ncbi:hypothetical protein AO501_05565 [Mycobacterium gordonae]|uniref:DNA polymerase I n=1 Tax=Mycobacterium gordonae TaxID=1778 RepID=A0A0Q2LZ32_MYCGO|nr:hypothetical protein AO501_05565 [Mycobacterium gordonae]
MPVGESWPKMNGVSFDVRGRLPRDGELAPWLAENSLGNRFGLAVAAGNEGRRSRAVALAIVAADGDGRYLDVAALSADDEAALSSWLADPGPPKAVHRGKWTMHALRNSGWTLRGVTSDTALAAHLLRPGRRNTELNDLLVQHMRCALPEEPLGLELFSARPDERAVRALILRACAVLDLADVLDEELARIDSSSLMGRVELPVQRVLADLESVGVAVDPAHPLSDAPDGRVHATYRHTVSATGALSSSQPNLRGVHARFVAGAGYAGLLTARYHALELRLLDHLSGGTGPIVGDRERTLSRALACGWSAHEVAAALKVTVGDAKEAVAQYLSGSLRDLLAGAVDDARDRGYAATLSGRRRYLPDLDSPDPVLRDAAERAVCATVLQGGAADVVKTAMITVDQAVTAAGLSSRMVAQIDDRLVFEVAPDERDTLETIVREQMACAYQFDAPLAVSVAD